MNITKIAIKDLSPDPANVRLHGTRNIDVIAASLRRFGQQKPIVVDNNGVVRAGNGTLAAARQLGWTEIDAVTTELNGSEAIAYAIADNRTAELAEWDDAALAAQLDALNIEDATFLDDVGFDADELAALLETDDDLDVNEDEPPAPPSDPITQPGQLWILGNHRLLCGDATNRDDVAKLMNGETVDLAFTSPPYNVGGNTMGGHLANADTTTKYISGDDKRSGEEYETLLNESTHNMLAHARYSIINVQMLAANKLALIKWLSTFAHHFADVAIWNKQHGPPAMGTNVLNAAFEFLFILSSDNNPTRRIKTANFRGDRQNVYVAGGQRSNEFSDIHAATFPVHLPAWILDTFSDGGDVLDVFAGTGTTMMAAEQLGRRSFCLEISPAYCDVIVNRWQALTGAKAEAA